MTEWTAHCGCVITCSDEDGEPVEFVKVCPYHESASSAVDDIAMENRAMSLARHAVVLAQGVDPSEVTVTLDHATRAATAIGPAGTGQQTATSQKISLNDFVANIAAAGTLAKGT
jgi:hypothetical protein